MASELISNDFLSRKCFEFFANEKKKKLIPNYFCYMPRERELKKKKSHVRNFFFLDYAKIQKDFPHLKKFEVIKSYKSKFVTSSPPKYITA